MQCDYFTTYIVEPSQETVLQIPSFLHGPQMGHPLTNLGGDNQRQHIVEEA